MKYFPFIALFMAPVLLAQASDGWLQQNSEQTSKKIIAEVASEQKKQRERLYIQMKISELRIKLAAEANLEKKQKIMDSMLLLEKQLRQG
ncbi:hypothetical protein L8S23_23465 [Enterobacter bugandensis]|uniref:hypothetical protein n=1 Tax=Enterobacter bugandensis TaxID=881260 RepID=UPI00200311AE|nr:hypothetical protein [Enterobacter bugandensis]MCK6880127.1 hypothetical protein [Enterobacter bugandensis]